MKAQLITNPIEVRNYLDEKFGVTKDQFIQAVQAGVLGRNNSTPNHPSSMPGFMCWAEATRELRDLLLPMGWDKDNTDNVPSVIHKARKIKIAVQNSNFATGLEWGHPQPINEKGDGGKRAAFLNERGFNEMRESTLNVTHPGNEGFWNLCIFCDEDTVRAELLCPIVNQDDGTFKDFHKRIILINDDNENGGVRMRRENPVGDSGFEINVTRKQA
jgi:hypothetical protein